MRVAILILAVSIAPFIRDSNSHAASKRGADAFAKATYSKSVTAFEEAQKLAPSSLGAFNLGTAQIAAGDRERGSATLMEALKDPALRADALFNRGNSALAAKAFEHAARDFTEVLRLQPKNAAAKRNLEIALLRQQQQQQQQSGADGPQKTPQQNQQKQQQQSPAPDGKQQPKEGDVNLEALLRSVQQQEQEELRRMKARAGEAKVGW